MFFKRFVRWSVTAGSCLAILFPVASFAQSLSPATEYARAPNEFESAIVMRAGTHEVLYEYEADKAHPAASLTKLLNAMAFLDSKPSWKKVTTLIRQDEVGGGRLRLTTREKITVQDLFYSSITSSANNAAMALARLSGKTKSSFLALMNTKASQAGARHSRFVDFSGMSTKNITTARDMALIGELAYAQPMIQKAASVPTYTMVIRNTGRDKTIKNTNKLLLDPTASDVYVVGGKTGYLVEAKNNLVTQLRPVQQDGTIIQGKDLMVVVLGSPSTERLFDSAKRLALWGFSRFEN